MSEPITIRKVTVREVRRPCDRRGTYTDGSKDPETIVWLFVEITDGTHTGYGECIPTSLYYAPGHIGRSNIDEWAETLRLAGTLIGNDARRLSRLIPEDADSDDANSLKDTLDFALHDLVGRRLGVPVSTLLGGANRPYVHCIPVIHVDTPDGMARLAADERRRHGYCYFKLKPIGEPEADVETLTRMRETMGPQVRYYMDANYALKVKDPDRIVEYMNRLADLGLETYEDPIDADFSVYRYIQERVRVKLMIDERARTPKAVLRVIEARCARMVNIHANWAGGFQPALRKAAVAYAGGLATMIGSTWYLGPGSAAYQTLSSLLPIATPCEQLFNEVESDTTAVSDPYEIRDGKSFIPDRPGLGVTPKMDVIEAMTVRKVVVE